MCQWQKNTERMKKKGMKNMVESAKTLFPILQDSYEKHVIWVYCEKCSGHVRVDLKKYLKNCNSCKLSILSEGGEKDNG
jgi:uncharacterized OB-fold protein